MSDIVEKARQLCVEIDGYADVDSQDETGSDYGSLQIVEILTNEIYQLKAQLEEARKDAERLVILQNMSGAIYQESAKHQFVGKLVEFIDVNGEQVFYANSKATNE